MKWFKRKQVEPYDINSEVPPTPDQVDLVLCYGKRHMELAKEAPEGSKDRAIHTQIAASYLEEAKIMTQLIRLDATEPLR